MKREREDAVKERRANEIIAMIQKKARDEGWKDAETVAPPWVHRLVDILWDLFA